MKTTMGEYVVGAYLKQHFECDVVDYNVRPPAGGLEGLAEFDVVGLRFSDRQAYICEVVTRLEGMRYGNNRETIQRIKEKHERQQQYAKDYLQDFTPNYMLWSPVVPKGYLTQNLRAIQGLELYINGRYKDCVDKLRADAHRTTRDTGNPFFRVLQILEHLRDDAAGNSSEV
jgi:hypothetical protein